MSKLTEAPHNNLCEGWKYAVVVAFGQKKHSLIMELEEKPKYGNYLKHASLYGFTTFVPG